MWKIENNAKLILPKLLFGPHKPKIPFKNQNEICTTKITFRKTHKTQKPPTRPFCASRVWRPRRENKKVLVFQHVHLIWLTRSKVQASQGINQPWNLTLHCIAHRAQIISESPFFFSYFSKSSNFNFCVYIWSHLPYFPWKFKSLSGKFLKI